VTHTFIDCTNQNGAFMNLKKILLTFSISIIGLQAWTQCNNKFTTKADFAYNTNSFGAAIEEYDKAMSKAGKDKVLKSCIQYQKARCHLHLNDYKGALKEFKKLQNAPPDNPLYYYEYGNLLKSEAMYEEAKVQFQKYVDLAPEDERGKLALKSCDDAITYRSNPTCHKIENMKIWNSKESDYSPIIADKKGTEVYFTSNREKSTGKPNELWDLLNEDFWFSKQDKQKKWSKPALLEGSEEVNTIYSEGSGDMDKKFSTLYFSRCFGDKKAGSGCRIYSVKQVGSKWEAPTQIALFPDSFVCVHPTVDASGKYMIFSSNYPDGSQGGMDLWIAAYNKKQKTFANPVNMGPTINSPAHEMFPYLKADGNLYMSSDRVEGLGGLDLYVCPKTGDEKPAWRKPENLQYPRNSEGDDFGIVFEIGKETGWFSSNRKGTKGHDDIWSFNAPQAKIILSGTVRDADTKAVIANATVKMNDGVNTFEATTDATGFYKKEIPFGVAYEMRATKKDYFDDVNRASSHGLDPIKVCNDTNLVADFYLKTQKVDLEFEIQFKFDKAEMFPEFVDSVENMVRILNDNPTMVVEIGGHTDSRGNDEYNEALSQRRSQAVVDSLIARGIPKERLVAKGYGEKVPRILHKDFKGPTSGFIFPKDTELTDAYINGLKDGTDMGEKKFEDAHQFNRRIHMHKLNDDYKPIIKDDDKND
jgi:peptidoglycan-associated lipoprotein